MPNSDQQDAKSIVEHLLEVTGSAILSGDFASFAAVSDLPQLIAVKDTNVHIETMQDMRTVFDSVRAYYKKIGVTELRRSCEFVEFADPDTLRTTHVTWLIADGVSLQQPYPVNSVFKRVDGVWKVADGDYSLDPNSNHAAALLRPTDGSREETSIFKRMASKQQQLSDPKAMEIYQANLDAVSTAILDNTPEAVLDHLRAPYFMRTTEQLVALNNREDILNSINRVRLSLRVQGATDYVRTTHHAFFRSETEIEGVHSTRILRGTELLTPPYENRMRLMLSADGKWQVVHAGRLDRVSSLSQADEVAQTVYQEYLDALSASNMQQDFDAWVALCDFPHTVVIDKVTRQIDAPEDIAPFFDMVSGLVRDFPDTTLHRMSEFATFVDSHTIRGYHLTTMEGGGTQAFPPVRGRFTIALRDGAWRMIETVNAISNPEFPYKSPIVSEALGSELDPEKDYAK